MSGFDMRAELAAAIALIAALRPTNTRIFRARQAEAIARIEAVRQFTNHPMFGLFAQNREFEARQAEALSQGRRARWMRLNCITDETAHLFHGNVPPSARLWAERVALFVRDRHSVTPAEVIAGLHLNQTDQAAQTRIARVLRCMGWRRHRAGKRGERRYVWRPDPVIDTDRSSGARRKENSRTAQIGSSEKCPTTGQNPGHTTNGEAQP